MILGIDVGYSHTKVWGANGEFSFKSTIEEGILDICNSIKAEFEGGEYTIGENSSNCLYDNEVNKIESLNFNLCLYAAIGMAMKNTTNEDIKLVTGLPASYYKTQKDTLTKGLTNKTVNITINGEPKRFTITDVIVFPQSSGVLLLDPNKLKGDVCVIDIGGYTVDLSFFNNKNLKKLDTFELGMNILANSIVTKIKNEYTVSYDILKVDDLLDTKEIIKDNKVINIENLLNAELEKHAKLILNRLNGMKEYVTSKHIFVGGGSYRLGKFLLNEELDKDTIFTNAKAFYLLGVNKFE